MIMHKPLNANLQNSSDLTCTNIHACKAHVFIIF